MGHQMDQAKVQGEIYKEVFEFVIPGVELIHRMQEGEEITVQDVIIEGMSIIPVGKLVSKGGKLFLKVGDKTTDITKKTIKTNNKSTIQQFCFAEGTKISIGDGFKNIEEVQIGDLVWSFNDSSKDVSLRPVINTVKKLSNHLQKLVIGNDTLFTTDDHPFYVSNTWKKAVDLELGDTLTFRIGNQGLLSYKERIDTMVIVYNFAVEHNHTYFVGEQEILVHNNNPCAASFKKLSADEVAKRLGTTVNDFHKNIKPLMKKDFGQEMKKIGTTNPDILIDNTGNIVLKNPASGKTILTGVPLRSYSP